MSTPEELRAKAAEQAERIKKLADEFDANGQKWKDDESRNAFNAAVEERKKIEADLEARANEEREAEAVRAALSNVKAFDERVMTRSIPGREPSSQRRQFGGEQITEETRALALAGWLRGEERSDEEAEAMAACRISGVRGLQFGGFRSQDFKTFRDAYDGRGYRHAAREMEQRTLSGAGIATGGALVPDTLVRTLEMNMLAFGGVRQVANVITTADGGEIRAPYVDDTANTGRMLGESAAVTTLDPTFGSVVWNAYKFTSDEVKVPYELLQDSAFDLAGDLGAILGERLGRITASKYATGTGASEPRGIVTASSVGKTTAAGTAITLDEVQDLIASIDPAYRSGSGFLMHDGVWSYLRKVKDGNARYYIQDDVTGTAVPRLFGYPVYLCQEMQSTVATATKTMLFGRLEKYRIRRVGGIRLYRLTERHRENDQDAFLAFVREDGNLMNTGTAPVKHLLQA